MPDQNLENFVARWRKSSGSERATKDQFIIELCQVLGVEPPRPPTGDIEQDDYCFEKSVPTRAKTGRSSVGKIDCFKAGCFILEAKQGSEAGAKKLGTAQRGTNAWEEAVENDALRQAREYARGLEVPVPFLIVCDIGYSFDLWSGFGSDWTYIPFPIPQTKRILLTDLPTRPDLVERLRKVWTDPWDLDPSRHAVKATEKVAIPIAKLSSRLTKQGNDPEVVARFLMRCLFTMFAEDTGLLPDRVLTNALRDQWLPHPASFPGGIESLWRAMNEGGHLFGVTARILKFNGGLFRDPVGLPLDKEALRILLEAAVCDWSLVEPAIFGTLLEQALDPKERHDFGAHFTPRAYVERLVRPTIEEPLREEWDVVRVEVRQILLGADQDTEKARKTKLTRAASKVQGFHQRLLAIRVLDPACGTGNFLYVAMDLMKRLESEVLALLADIEGADQGLLHMQGARISPEQFLGIEIQPWAKEIAELVLWIGYLQWHYRQYGKAVQVPEPVLRDYHNIECRDAVLAYDRKELARDEAGKPITQWDGVSTKTHPVTGNQVPDESKRIETWEYINPRKAEWPQADFIVGNPPFIGNKRMRDALGITYVEAIRSTWQEVPDSADYVMYWWHLAAGVARAGMCRRFGLITTNSLTMIFNRRVIENHQTADPPLGIVFAIPDHPWVDTAQGANVRISMTVGAGGAATGTLLSMVAEPANHDGVDEVILQVSSGRILADLSIGPDTLAAVPLRSNLELSNRGVIPHGAGFVVTQDEAMRLGLGTVPGIEHRIRAYRNGKDLSGKSRDVFVLDTFNLGVPDIRKDFPAIFQRLLEQVKPERDHNPRKSRRENWWRFAEDQPRMRTSLVGLERYVATAYVAKHRVFQFLSCEILPDDGLVAVASANAFHLGVLSSTLHVVWATQLGGRLGIGNDPRYNKSRCFDTFPFPEATGPAAQIIESLGESLDSHRKHQQAAHPDLTITGMYNVLEKLRSGEPLTDKDKVIHEQGLVSVLKQIHDELDAAVLDAYGWPHDLTNEQTLERLVALNGERAREEARGHVRWLRPEFQNPQGKQAQQGSLAATDADEETGEVTATAGAAPWPKKLPDQVKAVRQVVQGSEPWTAQMVAGSFKGANTQQVQEVLESLGALGILTPTEQEQASAWLPAMALQVSRRGGSTRPPPAN
jgi:hypothetical protein